MNRLVRSFGALGAVCVLLAGCGGAQTGPKGVTVTGTIVKDGKPLDVPNREAGLGNVLVSLVPLGPSPKAAEHALAGKDGSFKILGPGRGIPPGKYRLAVQQQDRGPGSDMLKGRFSEKSSPVEVEIPADKLDGAHDLGPIDLGKFGK